MLLMKMYPKLPLLNIRIGNTQDYDKILLLLHAECMFFGIMDPALCLRAFKFEFDAEYACPPSQRSPAR
jgi:hypothetical protein